jgi:hypothetical protein
VLGRNTQIRKAVEMDGKKTEILRMKEKFVSEKQ